MGGSAGAIASVAPHVTVISVSGFTVMPYQSAYLRASASRSRLAPQVMAYWFTSSAMARAAACFKTSGAAKFGNPCARLMAACSLASRVMPRITDSVNPWVRRAVCMERNLQRSRPRRDCRGLDLPCEALLWTLLEIREGEEVGHAPIRDGEAESEDAAAAIGPARRGGLVKCRIRRQLLAHGIGAGWDAGEDVVVPLRVEGRAAGNGGGDDRAAHVPKLHAPAREIREILRRIIPAHLHLDTPGSGARSGVHAPGRRRRGFQYAVPTMGVHLARVGAVLVTLTVVAIEALGTLGDADEKRRSRKRHDQYESSHRLPPRSLVLRRGAAASAGVHD